MRWMFIVLSLFMAQSALASGTATKVKIGFVDYERLSRELPDTKKAITKLKTELDKKQKTINKMREQFEGEVEAYKKQQSLMAADKRAKKEETLRKKQMDLASKFQKLQQELQQREAELMQKLEAKVVNVINKIGDRDSYDMILRVQPGVLYRKRHRDITDAVVKLYNQHYGTK